MPGTFTFKPIEATLLDSEDATPITHLFCVIITQGQSIRSKISASRGKSFYWDESINIVVRQQTKCLVELRNKDKGLLEDPIGGLEVDLKEIVSSKEPFKKWYKFGFKTRVTGKMLLESSFEPCEKGEYGFKLLKTLQSTIKQGISQGGLFASLKFISEGKDSLDKKFEFNFEKDKKFKEQNELLADIKDMELQEEVRDDLIRDTLGNHLSSYCYEHNKVRVTEFYPLSVEEQHWLVNGKDLLRGWGGANEGVSDRGGRANNCGPTNNN